MRLGRVARDRIADGGVVGITGSVGKTTTKDLVQRLPGVVLPDVGQRALLQQRAGPATDPPQRTRRCPVGRPRDGCPWHWAHQPSGRGGPPGRRDRHQRRHGPRRVLRRPRRGGAGEGRAGDGVARLGRRRLQLRRSPRGRHGLGAARARSSATPWTPTPRCGRRRGAQRGACRRGLARRRTATELPAHDTVGKGRRPSLPCTESSRCPNALAAAAAALWCGVPFDGVVSALAAVTGSALRMEVHHVPAAVPSSWWTATTPTRRRPRRRCARWPRSAPEGRSRCSGSWPSSAARPRQQHQRMARIARSWGSRSLATRPDLYGSAQVLGTDDAVALHADDRARGRAPRQGQPGGAPRRRRAGVRSGGRRFSRWPPTRSATVPRTGFRDATRKRRLSSP